jgi:hypothetical protein
MPAPLQTLSSASAILAPQIDDATGDLVAGQAKFEAIVPELGRGVLSIDGDHRGYAIVDPASVEESAAQVYYKMALIETQEELRRELGVSAAGSYTDVSFSAGGSVQHFERTTLDTYSFCIVVRVLVTTKRKVIPGGGDNLKDEILAAASAGRFAGIGRKYGDQYINGVYYGGEYIAVAQVSTRTASEYQQLMAQANLAVYNQFSSGAEFTQSFSRIKIDKSVVAIQIINGAITPIPDWKGIDAYARAFPEEVEKGASATPVAYTLQEISQATNYPIDAEGFLFSAEADRYLVLTQKADAIKASRASWDRVRASPDMFTGGNTASAVLHINELDALQVRLDNAIKTLLRVDIGKNPLPQMADIDVTPHRTLPPQITTTSRPQITVTWEEGDGTQRQETKNNSDPNNASGDWFRSHGGMGAALKAIKAEFSGPHEGIELEMNCRWGVGGTPTETGWNNASVWQRGSILTGVAFRLSGPAADMYIIGYAVHLKDVADKGHSGNYPGAPSPAGSFAWDGGYPVQGLRLVVYLA